MTEVTASPLVLRGYDFDTGTLRDYDFTGRLLGEGTSRSDRHVRLVHDTDSFAAPGERCSACRWFEVRIYAFYESDGEPAPETPSYQAGYYVETVGRTVVPGEVDRHRVRRVTDPRRVVATLVQEKDGRVFVPQPSRAALDQAADRDDKLATVVDDLVL